MYTKCASIYTDVSVCTHDYVLLSVAVSIVCIQLHIVFMTDKQPPASPTALNEMIKADDLGWICYRIID